MSEQFYYRLWKAWLDCATKLQQNFSSIKVPLLVLHGEADKIGDIKFSQNLYDEAQSQDKELKVRRVLLVLTLYKPISEHYFKV